MIASSLGLWCVVLVVLPITLALAAFVSLRRMQPILKWVGPPVMFALVVALIKDVAAHGPLVYEIGGWAAPLGITWKVDGLAVTMVAMTTVVLSAVCVYASAYFPIFSQEQLSGKTAFFWPLIYLLWASLHALFFSADIFNIYVTLELLTLGSVALIVLAGTAASLEAALRYFVLGLLASLLYLFGVALIYAGYGVLDNASLGQHLSGDVLSWTAASLMIIGLLIKTALFPMHFWLPPAHASAPAPVSAVLSALVVKASFYLILRLWFDVFGEVMQPLAAQLLGLLGACAVIWGGIQAFRSDRLKTTVAYSTVAQLGYLSLLFPLASTPESARTAWLGAIVFAVSHALAKAAMFLAVGRIQQVAGGDHFAQLAGIGQRAPLAVSATALAGVSLMGLPPSGGFAGKWMLLLAGLESRQWWWLPVLLLGGLLTAAYLFRFWRIALTSVDRPAGTNSFEWRLELPAFVLGTASILIVFLTSDMINLLEVGMIEPVQQLAEVTP